MNGHVGDVGAHGEYLAVLARLVFVVRARVGVERIDDVLLGALHALLVFEATEIGREQDEHLERYELVVVHLNRLDHVHEFVDLRHEIAELESLDELRVDDVIACVEYVAALGGLDHVCHGLVANVQ